MKALHSHLKERRSAILERWLEDTLGTYASATASFLGRTADPFSNPVGHALCEGTRELFDSLLDGLEPERTCSQLDKILRIRAIQDFSPSQAVRFLFQLKKAIREDMAEELGGGGLWEEWTELDSQIDQMALFAFDVIARCREQVYELRVNEVKRSVSALIGMSRRPGADPGADSPAGGAVS